MLSSLSSYRRRFAAVCPFCLSCMTSTTCRNNGVKSSVSVEECCRAAESTEATSRQARPATRSVSSSHNEQTVLTIVGKLRSPKSRRSASTNAMSASLTLLSRSLLAYRHTGCSVQRLHVTACCVENHCSSSTNDTTQANRYS